MVLCGRDLQVKTTFRRLARAQAPIAPHLWAWFDGARARGANGHRVCGRATDTGRERARRRRTAETRRETTSSLDFVPPARRGIGRYARLLGLCSRVRRPPRRTVASVPARSTACDRTRPVLATLAFRGPKRPFRPVRAKYRSTPVKAGHGSIGFAHWRRTVPRSARNRVADLEIARRGGFRGPKGSWRAFGRAIGRRHGAGAHCSPRWALGPRTVPLKPRPARRGGSNTHRRPDGVARSGRRGAGELLARCRRAPSGRARTVRPARALAARARRAEAWARRAGRAGSPHDRRRQFPDPPRNGRRTACCPYLMRFSATPHAEEL